MNVNLFYNWFCVNKVLAFMALYGKLLDLFQFDLPCCCSVSLLFIRSSRPSNINKSSASNRFAMILFINKGSEAICYVKLTQIYWRAAWSFKWWKTFVSGERVATRGVTSSSTTPSIWVVKAPLLWTDGLKKGSTHHCPQKKSINVLICIALNCH